MKKLTMIALAALLLVALVAAPVGAEDKDLGTDEDIQECCWVDSDGWIHCTLCATAAPASWVPLGAADTAPWKMTTKCAAGQEAQAVARQAFLDSRRGTAATAAQPTPLLEPWCQSEDCFPSEHYCPVAGCYYGVTHWVHEGDCMYVDIATPYGCWTEECCCDDAPFCVWS